MLFLIFIYQLSESVPDNYIPLVPLVR